MNLSPRLRYLALGSLLATLAGCNSTPSAARPVHLVEATSSSPAPTPVAVLEDAIRNDVYYLASDRLQGRGVGTQGLDLAADYIATRFRALGLKPLPGLDGYFQTFDITTAESIDPATALASGEKSLKLKSDFTAASFSAEKSFDAPVVFAGYGVSSKEHDYDDYANLDVKGKVVLVLRYEPHDESGKSRFTQKDDWSPNAHLETKAKAAADHGAVAVLMVNPPAHHGTDDALLPFSRQFVGTVPIPFLHVRRSVADELLERGGAPALEKLQADIDKTGKPVAAALKDVTAKGGVAIKRSKRTVKNVVAYLPSAAPTADQYVVAGAHYDHLGLGGAGSLMNLPMLQRQPGVTEPGDPHRPATQPAATRSAEPTTRNSIHHGADDNASGTAALLELARIYAHRKTPPARSVIFAAFTAEESGLIGSARFANNPPVDLKQVAAMLNLDMVGRIRKNLLYVGGGGTAEPFKAILKQADDESPLEFKNFGEGGLGPSDHMSFAVKKVPVIFLFSGTHEDYHRPTDTAEKINYDGIEKAVEVSARLVDAFARMPLSKYVDAADKHSMMSPQLAGEPGARRATLGVIPEYGGEEDGKGVKIGGTSANSPAEKAGLQAGDVVTKLGDKPTGTLVELSAALASKKPGDKLTLHYHRNGKHLTAEITLGERK